MKNKKALLVLEIIALLLGVALIFASINAKNTKSIGLGVGVTMACIVAILFNLIDLLKK